MASSNIKLFDENKGNMLSDSEFSISNQRLNGLQTGVASSQLQNKAMYQASLVAYAIAQVMMQNGLNANDTDAVSTFVSNLSNTMLQKVYDVATTAEAQAGVATGKWMSPALVKAAIDMFAAPAGYGLGSGEQHLLSGNDDLNSIGASGWYIWYDKVPAHAPVSYSTMRVDGGYGGILWAKQTIYCSSGEPNCCVLIRSRHERSEVWEEEWVNPPMKLGFEYRTTERYLGKPVYVKVVNFGELPNTTGKAVSGWTENAQYIVSYSIILTNGANVDGWYEITNVFINSGEIIIGTRSDQSAFSAYVTVYYTKTTD